MRDVVIFQGSTVAEIKNAFIESIEDYLAFCVKRDESPDKIFSGKFNLRLDPALHWQLYIEAKQSGLSLNQWVTEANGTNLISKLRQFNQSEISSYGFLFDALLFWMVLGLPIL